MGRGRRAGRRARPLGRFITVAHPLLVFLTVAVAGACGGAGGEGPPSPIPSVTPLASQRRTAAASPSPIDERSTAPVTASAEATAAPVPTLPQAEQPPAVGLLTVVDKQRGLPPGYAPPDLASLGGAYLAPGFSGSLRAEAKVALEGMLSDAYVAGYDIEARSGYRSYADQEQTFAYWVSVLGEQEARRMSAEAGHSEHQLGTAVDLTNADVAYDLTEAFVDTPGGRWLAANAYAYGFALSYPAGAEAVTGYAHEPWHYRYIGTEHAAGWRASGVTLGEYLRGIAAP